MIFTSKGKTRTSSRAITKVVFKIEAKRAQEKSIVAKTISTDLSYLFLNTEIACIRGHRKSRATNNEGQ